MSHRPIERRDFEGKTIKRLHCDAINLLRFQFDDGTAIAIEHERDGMVVCDECIPPEMRVVYHTKAENAVKGMLMLIIAFLLVYTFIDMFWRHP